MKRFWAKVRKTRNHWLWKAARASGYGTICGLDSKMIGAHRLSWILNYGPIPKGLLVLHNCDKKLCVRPEHLFLGTHQDNTDDMWEKGRQAKDYRHPSQKGEKNHAAKYTLAQVKHVRRLFVKGY